MLLRELPPQARPREKVLSLGPQSLSDAELLAILLRTGTAEMDVLEVAQLVLERHGGWSGLLHCRRLQPVKGLGAAKQAEMMAVLEIARRALTEDLQAKPILDQPHKVRDFLRLQIGAKPYETFMALWLNASLQLMRVEELARGTVHRAQVYPREVVRAALECNAKSVIFAHNHPGGTCQPSEADRKLTRELTQLLKQIEVQVIDHIIVTEHQVASLAEMGQM